MRRKEFQKIILLFAVLSIICSLFSLQGSFAQQDPNDPGKPDSVYFGTIDYYLWSDSLTGKLRVPIIFLNDEPLTGLLVPLSWTGALSLDSISFSGTRVDWITDLREVKIENENQRMWTKIIPLIYPAVIYEGTGAMSFLYFDIADTGRLVLDTVSFDGVWLAFGLVEPYTFTPQFEKATFYLTSLDPSPGDVNLNSSVELSDAIYLANYLLKNGEKPYFLPVCDVNADCLVSLADVIYIANHVLKGGPKPLSGCAWGD